MDTSLYIDKFDSSSFHHVQAYSQKYFMHSVAIAKNRRSTIQLILTLQPASPDWELYIGIEDYIIYLILLPAGQQWYTCYSRPGNKYLAQSVQYSLGTRTYFLAQQMLIELVYCEVCLICIYDEGNPREKTLKA